MKIAIASDHRGYEAKERVKAQISQMGHECVDYGTSSTNSVDYPDFAYLAAQAVSNRQVGRAILICGTGIGMCIAANKIKSVRAAPCYDELSAQKSRRHNNANVLCISGDLTGEIMLRKIVEIWLTTDFTRGRYQRHINKIAAIEDGKDPREIKNIK